MNEGTQPTAVSVDETEMPSTEEESLLEDDSLLVEDISIDGMCGVY